ncbi:hypothetical protein S83_063986 [Arachis hypogaea]|nr:uncharacterized protein DS421_18g629550 [Arachis hypogaea]
MNPNSLLSPLSTLFFHTVEIFTSYPHKSSSSNPLTSPGSTLAVAFLVALPSSQRGPFSPSLPHRDSLSSAPPFLHAQQPTSPPCTAAAISSMHSSSHLLPSSSSRCPPRVVVFIVR